MEIGERIISTAIENGATVAGIANMEALRGSPSHAISIEMAEYAAIDFVADVEDLPDNEFLTADGARKNIRPFTWPDAVKSVLVIGLSHPEDKPELDWWDGRGTLGNRILIDIIKNTSRRIENSPGVKTRKLHYYVEKGGVFLKDAAVLAGLGCIGKNNMVITPSYGPRIRLRALFLEAEIEPTGPIYFDPCSDCKVLCRSVCPENAMAEEAPFLKTIEMARRLPGRDGTYNRERCNLRMEKDGTESTKNDSEPPVIRFCRKCEFICPVGKK
jgi:epoxyqueuosine reductase